MFAKDIPRSSTSYTVGLDKLRQGVTYEFRVVAVNQAGFGEPSRPSTAVSGKPSGHVKGAVLSPKETEALIMGEERGGAERLTCPPPGWRSCCRCQWGARCRLYYAAPPWDCLPQVEPQTLSHCQGHCTDKVRFPCHSKNSGMVASPCSLCSAQSGA